MLRVIPLVVLWIMASEGLQFTASPEDQVKVLGETAEFHCHVELDEEYQGQDYEEEVENHWELTSNAFSPPTINARNHQMELEKQGITITEDRSMLMFSLSMPATEELNGTVVTCFFEFGNDHIRGGGNLTVLGPPSPPKPMIGPANNTHLTVSWEPPFTWVNHSITHYSVSVINHTSSNVDSWITNDTSFTMIREGGECDVLQVNITASSDIGEGEVGYVSGGFPIAPGPIEFLDCFDCKVTFLSSGMPMYHFSFSLPPICSYQTGQYEVIMRSYSLESDIMVHKANYTSTTPSPIARTISSDLDLNQTYTLEVIVSNLEGVSRKNHTFQTHFIPLLNQDPPTLTVINSEVLIAVLVLAAVLLVAVVVVAVIIICLRRRKRTGVAGINTKVFFEEHMPREDDAYVQPTCYNDHRLYETIDGIQEKLPNLPPPRVPYPGLTNSNGNRYNTGPSLNVPQIVFSDDRNSSTSNQYLQLLGGAKTSDPEVRSTGSGEYTTMKGVSLLNNEQQGSISAVNKLAVQTPPGEEGKEEGYVAFMEPAENKD